MRRVLLAALLCAACDDGTVLARVGKTRIRQADLDGFLALRPAAARDPQAGLRELADRALLAEGARRRDLRDRPEVGARVAAAEREVLAQALLDDASPTQEEALRKRYQSEQRTLARRAVHVAHALFQFALASPAEREKARARAMRVSGKAKAGENFEALARTESDDRVSGARGGDDGWLQQGEVDPLFFDRAAALKKGEVSEPVETSFGFFVIKALEEPKDVVPSFEQARGRLAAQARGDSEAALVEQLRKEIPVELHPERMRR